ncbi:hypothetical protein JTB14_009481 [Gonioctena quinquepunctata]|nr:hypothetical protein JTB14_009481 [Gonioctena quinquepunctata]
MKYILCLLPASVIFKIYEFSCVDEWPNCGDIKNVVCERGENCYPYSSCTVRLISTSFRKEIVSKHNIYRDRVALGQEERGGNGEAANMMVLSYDKDLEYSALCNQCNKGQDECRRTKKYTAGQNTHHVYHATQYSRQNQLNTAMDDWYAQVKNTSEDVIKSFSPGPYKEFTQMLWAETTRVGCVMNRKGDYYYLVCNYGNKGNEIGSPVYVKGTPCSKCPPGMSCNTEYIALCGEIDRTDLNEESETESTIQSTTQSTDTNGVHFFPIISGIYLVWVPFNTFVVFIF